MSGGNHQERREPLFDRRSLLQTGVAAVGLSNFGTSNVKGERTESKTAWTQLSGGRRHRGRSTQTAPSDLVGVRWSVGTGYRSAQPIVVGKKVFIGDSEGGIIRINRDTGKIQWRTTLSGKVSVAPAYHEGRLYAGTQNGGLYCLDADSGEIQWKQALSDQTQPPAVDKTGVYTSINVSNGGSKLLGFNLDGELKWQRQHSGGIGSIHGSPVAGLHESGVIYNINGNNDFVISVDRETGEVNWSQPGGTAIGRSVGIPTVESGNIYTKSGDGVVKRSAITGEIINQTKKKTGYSWSLSITPEGYVDIDHDRYRAIKHICYNSDGSVKWEKPESHCGTPPSSAGGEVYVVQGGALKSLDSQSGLQNWSFGLGNYGNETFVIGAPPVPVSDGILVQYDGVVYMVGDGSKMSTASSASRADSGSEDSSGGQEGNTDLGGSDGSTNSDTGRSKDGFSVQSLPTDTIGLVATIIGTILGLLQYRNGSDS